jgi:restriction system protein
LGSAGVVVVIAGLVFAITLIRYFQEHPAVFAGVVVIAGLVGAGVVWVWHARTAAIRRGEAELTSTIAAADALTGSQFEHWVAALLRRTGFTNVEVCGGSGDLGADVTAASPSGRRVVVQCKRLRADRAVGSPDVQRFAGTARALHHADIAVIITTGRFSAPAASTAARLNIALVDRQTLTAWAASGARPAPFAPR